MWIGWHGCRFPISDSSPNQTSGYLSFPLLHCLPTRVPALLKYILIFLRCGSLIVEVNIPRRRWQRTAPVLSADPAPISPLISFLYGGTQPNRARGRESERVGGEGEDSSHPLNGNSHFKRSPGKWAVPQCSSFGDGGIRRALRCDSKGY